MTATLCAYLTGAPYDGVIVWPRRAPAVSPAAASARVAEAARSSNTASTASRGSPIVERAWVRSVSRIEDGAGTRGSEVSRRITDADSAVQHVVTLPGQQHFVSQKSGCSMVNTATIGIYTLELALSAATS